MTTLTTMKVTQSSFQARLAQSAERKALNLVVTGSSPTMGVCFLYFEYDYDIFLSISLSLQKAHHDNNNAVFRQLKIYSLRSQIDCIFGSSPEVIR